MQISAKRRAREGGNAMTEFAIGGMVLAFVFTGTFQFGYAFYIYNNLENAVNNGAKYASQRTYEDTSATLSTCFKTAVQDMVAYGDPTGGTTTAIAPGLLPSNVSVTASYSNGVPTQLTVAISSYTINAVTSSYTLTNKPQFTYPFLGRYAPGETCSQ